MSCKAKEAQSTTTQLVDLLAKASDSDIHAVTDRINALKQEILDYSAPRQAEIKSLISVRRMLTLKVHPPDRKTAQPKKPKQVVEKAVDGTMLQKRIFDLLAAEGPMHVPAIAARLGSKDGFVANSIRNCIWFKATNGQVEIAKAN